MAFDIDLQNWAIDFDLQDRAEYWCKNVSFPNDKATISWPPSGIQGLKKAHQECVPAYLLAYSHRTTPQMIGKQITRMAVYEYIEGNIDIIRLAKSYNMSRTFLCEEITRYIAYINQK